MHIEVQVALNFVISYLYNKLPRRRVNIYGEELEKALKQKFSGHWYPGKPLKGSAFRCLKTGNPVDPVLEIAARESGVSIQDVLENLPRDLAVWVDPGEVSYRIGEKGDVKILYRESWDRKTALVTEDNNNNAPVTLDREVHKTFNPEARVFRPIEVSLANLSISTGGGNTMSLSDDRSVGSTSPSPTKGSPTFLPRSSAPLTFTTATFAQTKFGSTKLKSNSKRTNRMSPTEFSNYIKQRAILQQQHQQHIPVSSQHPMINQQQQHNLFSTSNGLNGNGLGGLGGSNNMLNNGGNSSSRCLSPSYYCFSPQMYNQYNNIQQQNQQQSLSPSSLSPNPTPINNNRWSYHDSTESTSPYQHLLLAN